MELLIRAFGGRFARAGCPWVVEETNGVWVDAQVLTDGTGALSGGERRLLAVVASLLDERREVALAEVLPGLDRGILELVLAAVAHAAGSHEQSSTLLEAGVPVGFGKLPMAYEWPRLDAE